MIRAKHRLQHRLMIAFALFTLGVSALFGLFAMAFVYTVEDKFMERMLEQEATFAHAHFAVHRQWPKPRAEFISLHLDSSTLPGDLAGTLTAGTRQREFSGSQGRHYHVLNLASIGQAPWLVAEVSQQLIVRPMRERLLRWLVLWGVGLAAVSLALAWWLARYTSAPLEQLAARLLRASPERLPQQLSQGLRHDEVGALALGFDALLARTRDFIEREQEFTRDVSHELRTPLAVLSMAIERVQADKSVSADVAKQLAAMRAATTFMAQAVETLLLLARESKREASAPVALLPLFEEWIVSHADWLDQQSLGIELRLSPRDRIALPEAVLRLALANLLQNAFAHGAAGGKVIVEMQSGCLIISNPAERPLEPAETLERQASDAQASEAQRASSTGFGFGLSIVQRLLERSGARIEVTHADGWAVVRIRVL